MPQVENLGQNVHTWHETADSGSSTHDLCLEHYRILMADPHAFENVLVPYNTDEPQGELGWGGDVEHPPYEDDPLHSKCKVCGKRLTAEDNYDEET